MSLGPSDCRKSQAFAWFFLYFMVKCRWVMGMIKRSENLRRNVEIIDLEGLVPQNHLLRKIDTVVDFTHIYELVEDLYCKDNGRP